MTTNREWGCVSGVPWATNERVRRASDGAWWMYRDHGDGDQWRPVPPQRACWWLMVHGGLSVAHLPEDLRAIASSVRAEMGVDWVIVDDLRHGVITPDEALAQIAARCPREGRDHAVAMVAAWVCRTDQEGQHGHDD